MATSDRRTTWSAVAGVSVIGSLVIGLLVLAFIWPTKTLSTHDLPVSIAGPQPAVAAVQAALDEHAPGTFELIAAADRDQAVMQVRARETYGGIVLDATGQPPEVLTAPAGSAVATQMLTAVAAQLQAQFAQQVVAAGGDASTAQVTVTAVVPLSASDPTGTGLAAASFPLMFGGLLGGVLISLLVVGRVRRVVALVGFSAASGLVIALVMQTWFAFLQGSFWMNILGITASILATSAFVVGFAALLGRAGLAIAAVVTMLFANPISAAATPWQFIAAPWGTIGQYFVPGASNWLIRSLSYFPDASNAKQWSVLGVWIVGGLVLTLIGRRRLISA